MDATKHICEHIALKFPFFAVDEREKEVRIHQRTAEDVAFNLNQVTLHQWHDIFRYLSPDSRHRFEVAIFDGKNLDLFGVKWT